MFARDLVGFDLATGHTSLTTDSFWDYSLSEMTPLRIEFFYQRSKGMGLFEEAKSMIRDLQSAVLRAINTKKIERQDMMPLAHHIPEPVFTLDEFIDGLNQLTDVRQNAVLFALDTGIGLERLIDMKWNDNISLTASATTKLVLKMQAERRHAHLPYVFWEWVGKNANPLVTLCEDVEMAFAKSWAGVVSSYKEMLNFSPKADAAHMRHLLDELSYIEKKS